jgi:hypothetical protein
MNWRSSLTPMLDAQTLQAIDAWVEGKRPAPIGPAEGRLLASTDAALERSIRGAADLVPAKLPESIEPTTVETDPGSMHRLLKLIEAYETATRSLLLGQTMTTGAISHRPGEIFLIDWPCPPARAHPQRFDLARPPVAADYANFADEAEVRRMLAELPSTIDEFVAGVAAFNREHQPKQREPEQGYTYRWRGGSSR